MILIVRSKGLLVLEQLRLILDILKWIIIILIFYENILKYNFGYNL